MMSMCGYTIPKLLVAYEFMEVINNLSEKAKSTAPENLWIAIGCPKWSLICH